MRKVKNTVFDVDAWHRELMAIQQKLLKKYRRGQPNPDKMPAYKLGEEYDMLQQLCGTTFMTKSFLTRWLKVDRAHSSMVISASVYPW